MDLHEDNYVSLILRYLLCFVFLPCLILVGILDAVTVQSRFCVAETGFSNSTEPVFPAISSLTIKGPYRMFLDCRDFAHVKYVHHITHMLLIS